jgi:GTP-binding protein YchF
VGWKAPLLKLENSMKVALLGFAQSGKKTFFNLLTGRSAAHRKEGEAVEGIAPIRDARVDALSAMFKPERTKYAENLIVLCPDMEEGGKREWLETARRCEVLCLVVRGFTSDQVYHPKGSVDATRDRSLLEAELVMADLEMIEKRLDRMQREKRGGQTPQQALEEATLGKIKAVLDRELRFVNPVLDPHELEPVKSLGLLCLKPALWAYNVDESAVAGAADDPAAFKVSCKIEQEIMTIDNAEERQAYLKEIGLSASGLDRLNATAYDALGLMSFYTVGQDEVRAWTVRKGSTAPTAAGRVHSDIERGFIRAEIMKYDDLMAAGNEAALKAAGKMQVKGKDYVIEDGDICHFRFNV